jgi:hypothetical protein
MFATVRRYVIEPEIVDALADRVGDLDGLLAGVSGCAGGQIVRTREGVIVVIIGDDEPVLVEAGRQFAAWCRRNVPALTVNTFPDVWSGDLLLAS